MRSYEPDYVWSWWQYERVSDILSLRKAILEQNFSDLDPIFQCKILTNLGCNLNHIGSFVEAIKYWDSALAIIPNFAMALGNKGKCLFDYGKILYDYGHTGILIAHAKDDLNNAISQGALWDSGSHPEAKDDFKQYYDASVKYLED